MKKLKNGCHFVDIDHMDNFQITDPPKKAWVSGFLSVNRNGISMSAIMTKSKNGFPFTNHPAETSKNSDNCNLLKVSDIGIALYSMEI